MDAVVPLGWSACNTPVAGLRGPERKYAVINFETAAMWQGMDPEATQLVGRAGALTFKQACRHDVSWLASSLESRLRASLHKSTLIHY